MQAPIVSKESAKRFLISVVPDYEWLLAQMESDKGWLRLPKFLTDAIQNLRIDNYPLLYENEAAIGVVFLRSLMEHEDLQELNVELLSASAEERGGLLEAFGMDLENGLAATAVPRTQAEQEAARKALEALPEQERADLVKRGQYFYSAFFATFGQTLALMVHGEKLTALVAQAKGGNDEAFVKAVHIDKRILTAIPFFQERLERAQRDGEQDFLEKLSYRLASPQIRGRIRHKSLWLTFAILDGLGLLNRMSHPELLGLCDEAGVGGERNRIADVKYLTKRLKEYRDFQKRGISATP